MTHALLVCSLMGCSLVNDPGAHMTGDAGASGASIPLDQLCVVFAQAFCDAIPRCCSTVDTTPANCVPAARQQCTELLAEVMTDRRVNYDPVVAAQAIARGQALAGSCATTELLDWLSARDGLFAPFSGTIEGGNSCEPIGDSVPEQAVTFLICENEQQNCRGPAGGRTCQARAGLGMPCNFRLDCQDGMRCIRAGEGLLDGGTCDTSGEPVGSPCRLDDECQALNCTADNFFVLGVCADPTQDGVYCPM